MSLVSKDKAADILWKWTMRISGLGAFFYVLFFKDDAPVAVYITIGGLIGLPNVISWQQALNRGRASDEEG